MADGLDQADKFTLVGRNLEVARRERLVVEGQGTGALM
jgi:hypothetical protein